MQITEFTNPITRYRGEPTPENIEFNAHFQHFSNRLSILCALQTNGKISSSEAYEQLVDLWEQLQPYCSLIAEHPKSSTIPSKFSRFS